MLCRYPSGMNKNRPTTPGEILSNFSKLERCLANSQESLAQLFAFIEELPIGILDFDLESRRVTSVNRALRDLSGYGAHEISTMDPHKFLTSESMEQMEQRVKQSLAGEHISDHSEYAFITKSGKILWGLLAHRIIYKGGKPQKILAVVQDITERKRLEKARQEGEEKFRNILENTQDCFLPNGYSRRSYLGKPCYSQTASIRTMRGCRQECGPLLLQQSRTQRALFGGLAEAWQGFQL